MCGFSCQFVDSENDEPSTRGRRKIFVSNQKGYALPRYKEDWDFGTTNMEAVVRDDGVWKVILGDLRERKGDRGRENMINIIQILYF
jgi:hypothetical protein